MVSVSKTKHNYLRVFEHSFLYVYIYNKVYCNYSLTFYFYCVKILLKCKLFL